MGTVASGEGGCKFKFRFLEFSGAFSHSELNARMRDTQTRRAHGAGSPSLGASFPGVSLRSLGWGQASSGDRLPHGTEAGGTLRPRRTLSQDTAHSPPSPPLAVPEPASVCPHRGTAPGPLASKLAITAAGRKMGRGSAFPSVSVSGPVAVVSEGFTPSFSAPALDQRLSVRVQFPELQADAPAALLQRRGVTGSLKASSAGQLLPWLFPHLFQGLILSLTSRPLCTCVSVCACVCECVCTRV